MNLLRRWALLFAVAVFVSNAFAQAPAKPNPSPAQGAVKKNPYLAYAGNWISSLDSKPWFLLNLNLAGEQFSGSLQRARKVEFNDNGDVKAITEEFFTFQLADATLNPDGLLLTLKDPDTQETQRYIMKLTGDTTAEIKMIAMIMPPGMPKPKPWKLTKAAAPVKPAPR